MESAAVENLKMEIRELEIEMEKMQSVHGQEIQSQKADFERQLQVLKDRVASEENSRRKLHEELQRIHCAGSGHENEIAELRQQFEDVCAL